MEQRYLHEGLLQEAANHPSATAVVEISQQGATLKHTFGDLRDFALRIRRFLVPLIGTQRPHNVGVLAEGGGLPLYASWLAVMWEDCTVVPLSTAAPPARLGSMIADAGIKAVLVTDEQGATIGKGIHLAGHVEAVVDVRPLVNARESLTTIRQYLALSDNNDEGTTRKSMEAYIIYTSGSSGTPKGVSSGHDPMLNRLQWMWREWPFQADEVCCQRIDHVFIDFVSEVFGPLCRGLPILVVPIAVRRSPALLAGFIRTFGVSRITLVPTLAQLLIATARTATTDVPCFPSKPALASVGRVGDSNGESQPTRVEATFPSVVLWVLSGEALPWSIARGLSQLSSPGANVLNLYGSTEVAADITYHSCTFGRDEIPSGVSGVQEANGSVPIGKAISGCGAEIFELTDNDVANNSPPIQLREIPASQIGIVGALYVSGLGLSTGYWGQPIATKERFPVYTWDDSSSSFRLCDDSSAIKSDTLPMPAPGGDARVNGGQRINQASKDTRRFFRTGDLASYERCPNSGGENGGDVVLVFRGRLDQQVKVRGQRLDLAEVEKSLTQAQGVVSAAAIALSNVEAHDQQETRDAGGGSACMVGALVTPAGIDETDIIAACRRNLPSFAVPQVIATAASIPTLSGSGKVDRLEVKRILQNAARRDHDATIDYTQYDVDEMAQLVSSVLSKVLRRDSADSINELMESAAKTRVSTERRGIFDEMGLSSLQAVRLVYELRLRLHPEGNREQNVVSLADVYECRTAALLAKRLVETLGLAPSTASKQEEGAALSQESQTTPYNADGQGRSTRDSEGGGVCGVHLQQVTTDIFDEVCLKMSSTFLESEPLLRASYSRCRASVGPLAGAILPHCYRRLVRRNTKALLRTGGRVLVAVDDKTEKIVGFTVGTEMVDTTTGSGFQLRADDAGYNVGNGGGEDLVDDDYSFDGADNLWRRFTTMLLHLPLSPMIDPISAVIKDLLDNYQRSRGWAYAAGEVLYISETGYNSHDSVRHHGDREASLVENNGVHGIRGVLVAQALEQRLLDEAMHVGYIRAVTICTNSATVHVARELEFKEIFYVSPIQAFRSSRRCREDGSRCITFPWQVRKKVPQQGESAFVRSYDCDVGRSSSVNGMKKKDRRPYPFAGVAEEHSSVVLFEKILAPRVPPDLFLEQESAAVRSSASITEVVSGVDDWELMPFQETQWRHRSAALAILADAVPALAASGQALQYMKTDSTENREAFAILTSTRTPADAMVVHETSAGGTSDNGHPSNERRCPAPFSSSGLPWSVVGCVSWRRGCVALNSRDEKHGVEVSWRAPECNEDSHSSSATVLPWREILVLALDQRWRYRGVGTAVLRKVVADGTQQGDRLIYVRSLAESVAFYKRFGFHQHDTEALYPPVEEVAPGDGEHLLVYEIPGDRSV